MMREVPMLQLHTRTHLPHVFTLQGIFWVVYSNELQQDPRFAGQVSEGGMMSFAFAIYWFSISEVDTSRTSYSVIVSGHCCFGARRTPWQKDLFAVWFAVAVWLQTWSMTKGVGRGPPGARELQYKLTTTSITAACGDLSDCESPRAAYIGDDIETAIETDLCTANPNFVTGYEITEPKQTNDFRITGFDLIWFEAIFLNIVYDRSRTTPWFGRGYKYTRPIAMQKVADKTHFDS